MDFLDSILSMLRGDAEEAPEGLKDEADARAAPYLNPEYVAYKREAVAMGEPVKSVDEWKQFKAGN